MQIKQHTCIVDIYTVCYIHVCCRPGVVDWGEGEGGDSVGLQQLGEEGLHLALVIAATLLQLHGYLLQLHLDFHLVLKLALCMCV